VNDYLRHDKGNLNFLDLAGIGFDRLKLMLTSFVRRKKIRIVIVDYWQLIGGQRRAQSRAEFLDEIAQWFSEFAKQENISILMASQTNQEGNTRGSEGMRLAFDQVYQLHPSEAHEGGLWIEMMDTRYTPWNNLGNDSQPAFWINPKGVFIQEAYV
jgi:replicative DNA helicase